MIKLKKITNDLLEAIKGSEQNFTFLNLSNFLKPNFKPYYLIDNKV